MKRMLDQKLIELVKTLSASDIEWINSIKEHILWDNDVGSVAIEALTTSEIFLPSLSALVNEDEEPLFPFENAAGCLLVVNNDEDGLVTIDPPRKLYKHNLEVKDDEDISYNLIIISKRNNEYTISSLGTDLTDHNIISVQGSYIENAHLWAVVGISKNTINNIIVIVFDTDSTNLYWTRLIDSIVSDTIGEY